MRSKRIALLVCLLVLVVPIASQKTQAQVSQAPSPTAQQTQQPTTTPPQRDSQGVSAVQSAISAAGGTDPIAAMQDFSASGNITQYLAANGGNQVQGTVTLEGRLGIQYRMDVVLPSEKWSRIISGRQMVSQLNGRVYSGPPNGGFIYRCPALPIYELNAGMNSTQTSISYIGPGQIPGHSVIEIAVGTGNLPSQVSVEQHREHFFVDATSMQVVKTSRMLRSYTGADEGFEELYFDDYQTVNGIAVPFEITEVISGQTTWTIQLSTIQFNVGLTDGSFPVPTSPTPSAAK